MVPIKGYYLGDDLITTLYLQLFIILINLKNNHKSHNEISRNGQQNESHIVDKNLPQTAMLYHTGNPEAL